VCVYICLYVVCNPVSLCVVLQLGFCVCLYLFKLCDSWGFVSVCVCVLCDNLRFVGFCFFCMLCDSLDYVCVFVLCDIWWIVCFLSV
jgi:hypothetical protein